MNQTPAQLVIERFGGIKAVADACSLERTAVQRWTYDAPKGTGGTIPVKHWPALLESAKKSRIRLRPADLLPPGMR